MENQQDDKIWIRMALLIPYMGALWGSFWLIDHVIFPEANQWQKLFVSIMAAISLNHGLKKLIERIEAPKKED